MNKQCKSCFVENASLSQENKNEDILNMMDENENFIIGYPNSSEMLVDGDGSAGNSMSDLVPELKGLHLRRKLKSDDPEQLAGRVRATIPASGLAIVDPAPGDGKILDVGTAIFALTDEEEPRHLGLVADVFGSVGEPMYSLQIGERAVLDTLRVDAEVYYLRDHPSTGYISVKREANDRYTIVRHRDVLQNLSI